jgi:hypothetical protein
MAVIDPNLPGWERLARGFAGAALVAGALVGATGWAQIGLLAGGAALLAMALAGFCPACSLAGRRLARREAP